MRFNFTSTSQEWAAENIPQPQELTNKLSQQHEIDIAQILNEISTFLRLHGRADRSVYIVRMINPESCQSNPSQEMVLTRTAEILADERNWNVKFQMGKPDELMITLRAPDNDPSNVDDDDVSNMDEVDQLDLF